ncbi:unnamed protein product [Pleuronectes platessa]|uniref:Uncharacterized protein n=1 Tax=Pleuronectes platessa TaxID=8262 RepID=A0A9N7TYA7_PLEPL|nr:unnamed protein product [Pleuronectes platessa]
MDVDNRTLREMLSEEPRGREASWGGDPAAQRGAQCRRFPQNQKTETIALEPRRSTSRSRSASGGFTEADRDTRGNLITTQASYSAPVLTVDTEVTESRGAAQTQITSCRVWCQEHRTSLFTRLFIRHQKNQGVEGDLTGLKKYCRSKVLLGAGGCSQKYHLTAAPLSPLRDSVYRGGDLATTSHRLRLGDSGCATFHQTPPHTHPTTTPRPLRN